MALSEDMCEPINNNSDTDWRNGPAKLWYDMIGLPLDCQHFDYGFKLETTADDDHRREHVSVDSVDAEEAFNLVAQRQWERDVIWFPEKCYNRVMESAKRKLGITGWLPIDDERTATEFIQLKKKQKLDHSSGDNSSANNDNINNNIKGNTSKKSRIVITSNNKKKGSALKCSDSAGDGCAVVANNTAGSQSPKGEWISTLDIEPEELVSGHWESEVIWDPNAMQSIPCPKIVPIDPCDIFMHTIYSGEDTSDADIIEEAIKKLHNRYNISNDEFYQSMVKTDVSAVSDHHINILHSIPALELNPLFFPRCVRDYRSFYSSKMKRYSRGALASTLPQNVLLCYKQIKLKRQLCEEESLALSDSSNLMIKTPNELSAVDGDIIITEFFEDYPPLRMQPGMGFKIINYFKKPLSSSNLSRSALLQRLDYRFGEQKQVISRTPFLGELSPGQNMQSIESNMFRAPIFEHKLPDSDFLVIRTREFYYVRAIDALYTMGQQLPLIEVPALRSIKSRELINNFIKATIYRMFSRRKSIATLKDELKSMFTGLTDDRIKKCVTSCADYQPKTYTWVLKNHFTEEQIRSLITPEECCALYSLLIAEQRGYGDRLLLDENSDHYDKALDIAPWNTTNAYVTASKGNHWLNLNNLNPDGSLIYSLMSKNQFKIENPYKKKCEPVSDRSLKRKPLKFFHEWLTNYGLPHDQVKQIRNRFEASDLVKQLSNKIKKNGFVPQLQLSKSAALAQQYKDTCQDIFERQTNRCSREEPSSDDDDDNSGEDSTSECDSELEEMGKDLEKMFVNNRTQKDIERERDEQTRKELYKLVYGDSSAKNGLKPVLNGQTKTTSKSYDGKVLRIFRTFLGNDGQEYTRSETVRKPEVINAYVRISETKDKQYIQRLNLVRNHNENESKALNTSIKSKKSKANSVANKSLIINKSVSNNSINNTSINASKRVKRASSANASSSSKQLRRASSASATTSSKLLHNDSSEVNSVVSDSVFAATEELVRIDDIKLTFSRKVVEEAHEIEEKERRKEEEEHEDVNEMTDYTTRRTVNRRRIDPMVKLVEFLDQTIVLVRKLEDIDDITVFNKPVPKRNASDYYDVIKSPMDLKTIREKVHDKEYGSHREFLTDIELIYDNAVEYNGGEHQISLDAKVILDFCIQRFDQNRDFLNQFEAEINPWVSGESKDKICFILKLVIDQLRKESGFDQLMILGTKNTYKQVCTDKPIDYNIIGKKIKDKAYDTFDSFRADCNIVYETCAKSFYTTHLFTIKAKEIANKAEMILQQYLADVNWGNQSSVLTNIANTIGYENTASNSDDHTSVKSVDKV